ncbi:cupin domain-containing protein [Ramlibacter sp. AN1015]|uniref:cupin domain-containing protein n=1 Tax=Ramlibacter sp. AN1015 TaxID=3133428 RepID=UPI0030BD4527
MRISLDHVRSRLPLPATPSWPDGVWDIEALARGSLSVQLFTPRGKDWQSSHAQDELYVVLTGKGVLRIEDERHPFEAGDVLFVAARRAHRFEEFSQDLVTWAIFWGPEGGEAP